MGYSPCPLAINAFRLQADDKGSLTIVTSHYHYSAGWTSIDALVLKDKLATLPRTLASKVFTNPASLTAWINTAAVVAQVFREIQCLL